VAEKAVIAFLVNGEPAGAMGIRARSFEQWLRDEFDVQLAYRTTNKVRSIWQFLRFLMRIRPEVCYVFDMSFSGVLAAGLYRLISPCRIVVDTGDAIYELSKSTGNRSALGLWLTRLLERYALAISDRVVVRSHPHQELFARRGILATVVPDGVDTGQFFPRDEAQLRREIGLHDCIVIGLVGSLVWSPRWQMCYGSELVEVIDRLRDLPVKGLIVGDGSGMPELQKLCAARGLEDRVVFAGRLPYDQLPRYLNAMDICLSTQTNDVAGQVRTTGKLPLYLACGRFVLASEVGEAARVLPPEMLVPYQGTKDDQYGARLADRIHGLLAHPESIRQSASSVAIANEHFEYGVLAARVRDTLYGLLANGWHKPSKEEVPVESRSVESRSVESRSVPARRS
jgi:glycosyltransferase involved in cell wall biosynthesis